MSSFVRRRIRDQHVRAAVPLPTPLELVEDLPVPDALADQIDAGRALIRDVLAGRDPRALVVVGPCSIDSEDAALEYAGRLAALRPEVEDQLVLAMRVYFEKPRTTVGWKGLVNDPDLDGRGDLPLGLRKARRILVEVGSLGLPTATEFLEPVIPQYLADLVTWAAIGARTTESPTHRQMASGLSMPVGFKNGTDGGWGTALDAMVAADAPHHFLGIDPDGRVAVIETSGNPDRHLILRGGARGTNYDARHIQAAARALGTRGLPTRVLVDCSHGNSEKDPERQPGVVRSLLDQIHHGEANILGWMIESYLVSGRQALPANPADRLFGCSLTDACLGWEETRTLLIESAESLRQSRATG